MNINVKNISDNYYKRSFDFLSDTDFFDYDGKLYMKTKKNHALRIEALQEEEFDKNTQVNLIKKLDIRYTIKERGDIGI